MPHQVVMETKGEWGSWEKPLREGRVGIWVRKRAPGVWKEGGAIKGGKGGKKLCQERSPPQGPGGCGPQMPDGAEEREGAGHEIRGTND